MGTDVGGVKTGFAFSDLNDLQLGPNGGRLYDILADGRLTPVGTPVMSGTEFLFVYSEIP